MVFQIRKRTGFTLVELLVSIAVIGTLTALLLPAVQSAREAARQLTCKNNLRQIGIGMHHYKSAFRKLPPGYEYERGPEGNRRGYSWGTSLLPFLELGFVTRSDQLSTTDLRSLKRFGPPAACRDLPLSVRRCFANRTGENGKRALRHVMLCRKLWHTRPRSRSRPIARPHQPVRPVPTCLGSFLPQQRHPYSAH